VNWMLWGGLGIAVIALICVLGLVFVYVLGSIGGDSTPTPTAPSVARATSTPTTRFVTPHVDEILLNDDFSSQKISEENGWVFDTGENVDWGWATNRLIATVKRKQWIGWNTIDGYYDDFGAETEAQAATNEYAEYGIIFRITGSSSEDRSYYIFGVSTTGKYFLEKRFAGAWAKDPVSATASTYIKQGTGKNRLGVIAQGSRIWLFINGYQVKVITDDSIAGGEIGVYSGTGDNDTTKVIFNRFTVMSAEKAKTDWGAK